MTTTFRATSRQFAILTACEVGLTLEQAIGLNMVSFLSLTDRETPLVAYDERRNRYRNTETGNALLGAYRSGDLTPVLVKHDSEQRASRVRQRLHRPSRRKR